MIIRQIYKNPINKVESHLSNVSMTLPDQTYSIKDLFEKYRGDTLELVLNKLKRNLEYDGQEVDFNHYVGELDANEVYARQGALTAKYEYLKKQELNNKPSNQQPTEQGAVTETECQVTKPCQNDIHSVDVI